MARANHEFLIEKSSKYLSFYQTGLGQVEKSEPDGRTFIRLFDPNESLKSLFETIEAIWPVLKPEFNKKVKISRIEILPVSTPNKLEFNFDHSPNSITVKFSPEGAPEIQEVVDQALEFYESFLVRDMFMIQIRSQTNFNWTPYSDGDIHIIKDLTNLVKSHFLNRTSTGETEDPIYWVREILINIKNSKKYVPQHLIHKTLEKYIELDFIMSSLD
jgi:hypothetical protein